MLPPPTPSFLTRKSKILSQLSVPDVEYTDASPKGSVDVAIRELIDEINHGYEGLVTTSSCAGRVSVYLEGVKRKKNNKASGAGGVEEGEGEGEGVGEGGEDGVRASTATAAVTASSSGGKGGGEWLFVSHDPLETVDAKTGREYDGDHWMEVFGLTGNGSEPGSGSGDGDSQQEQQRLIHFKFEPMILHILTTSPYHAHLAIQSGMTSGFRETGAVSILPRLTAPFFSSCHQCHTHHNPLQQQLSSSSSSSPPSSSTTTTTPTPTESVTPNPIVAIRSMGLSFESLIGVQRGSQRQSLVSSEYLSLLVKIANERFEENKKRIARFKEALRLAFGEGATAGVEGQKKKKSGDGESGNAEWEDAEARKQRKREEGLARREEVRRRKEEKQRKQEEIKEEIKEENAGKVDLAEVVLQVPDVL
ncbi:methyltransferase TYW3-domain-containing protein [Neurospora hispaniola]|uniref:tRNA(Phe) 7-[(3-amino-3-carboxypropyl)-4-demethylwyosine(37)-N(4)]-methyltransferase n=1 Tax=Neurospora hispaniola TaxID=588809 RepID=A0AAJ0MPP7_9PEZI|nr:methyltransferase TYW3-domain-containing protein [Neurospora hispaniola]